MNTLPPNQPLDEQERELARILHALPGDGPPPALDAKILRAAANAAASSNKPVRRALASAGALWGIGSAAAAVLALGVFWQLRYGVTDEGIQRERTPAAHAVSDSAEDDSVQVDIPARAANAPAAAAAPAAAMPPAALAAKPAAPADSRLREQAQAQPIEREPAAPAAGAAPEPFAADKEEAMAKLQEEERNKAAVAEGARVQEEELKRRDELAAKSAAFANAAPPPPPPPPPAYRPAAVRGGFVAAQSPRQAAAASAARSEPAPAPAAAPAAPAAAPPAAAAQSRADAASLDSVAATGSVAKTEAAPRQPEAWLADIRKLRDQGKTEEARASLVEFRKKYPKWVIPTDLARLQKE